MLVVPVSVASLLTVSPQPHAIQVGLKGAKDAGENLGDKQAPQSPSEFLDL